MVRLTSINGFLNLHNLLIIKGFTPPAYKNGFLDNLTGNMWLYIEQVVYNEKIFYSRAALVCLDYLLMLVSGSLTRVSFLPVNNPFFCAGSGVEKNPAGNTGDNRNGKS